MNYKLIKKLRVAVSLIFLLSIIVLFLDLSFSLPENFAGYPVYLQFVPSLLKFISIGTVAAAGFFIVLLLTVLFGRIYCSTICPLGILQDVITYIRKQFKKLRYSYSKPFTKTRYSVLAAAVILLLSGSVIGLLLLDPYSNFGRIILNIIRPATIGLNNAVAFTSEHFNQYWFYPVEWKGVEPFAVLFSFSFLAVVIWLSIKYGRLYCNTVCPVGTLLGFISKYSIFRLTIEEENCKGCSACEKVCKSSCIDTKNKYIDFSRCVDCFNCFTVCPTSGIKFKFAYSSKKEKTQTADEDKRDFLKKTAVYFIGTSIIAKAQEKIEVYKESTKPVLRKYAVSPPGSSSLENFTDNCTACHLCVAACPTQVLQPSFLEYGLLGIMQPRMDYKKGFCNYDCTICGSVCPSGAILEQKIETKKLIQLGKAQFEKENCIVYSQGTDCGACAEHCPTKAVHMELDPEVNRKSPHINEETCIGCGACEYACPTFPYKSIWVKSNPEHLAAKKPEEEKLEQNVDLKEEFPF